ncbi:MAG: O-antigen ligase family protein [Pseudomonadota bacterium]
MTGRRRRQTHHQIMPWLKRPDFENLQISRRLRAAAVPALLMVFTVFGGANGEALGVHGLLLLLSGCVCAICVLLKPRENPSAACKWLSRFLIAGLVIGVLQLIALPVGVWRLFGVRSVIEQGWQLLQLDPGLQSISVAPHRTIMAMSYLLIPAAFLLSMHRLGWHAVAAFLPWTIAILGAASAGLGLLQVMLPNIPELYLYVYTARGAPVGLFANINQQAMFLLMCLPFTATLIAKYAARRDRTDQDSALLIAAYGLAAMQLVSILAAGSVAGYLILVPVLGFFYVISQTRKRRLNLMPMLLGSIVLLPAVLLVAYSPQLSGLGVTSITNDGPMSRIALADVGLDIFQDHFWFGTGLGTFEPVFKTYEDPDLVTLTYANHVHNDYLQWGIETGLPGLLLLATFMVWLVVKMIAVWRAPNDSSTLLRQAAAGAAIVPVLHSLVEYPLRAPALLALASVCVILMVLPYVSRRGSGRGAKSGQTSNQGAPNQLVL